MNNVNIQGLNELQSSNLYPYPYIPGILHLLRYLLS